jgi:hypothetical protein
MKGKHIYLPNDTKVPVCCLVLLMLLKDREMNNLFNLKLQKMLAITHILQRLA